MFPKNLTLRHQGGDNKKSREVLELELDNCFQSSMLILRSLKLEGAMNGCQAMDSFFGAISLGEDAFLEDFSSKNRLDVLHARTKGGIYFRHLVVRNDVTIIDIATEGNLVFEDVEIRGTLYLRDVSADSLVFLDSFFEISLVLSRVIAGSVSINETRTGLISFDVKSQEAVF